MITLRLNDETELAEFRKMVEAETAKLMPGDVKRYILLSRMLVGIIIAQNNTANPAEGDDT